MKTLHDAIRVNNRPMIMRLIKRGADVNEADADGNRPGHIAAIQGRLHILLYLVHHGADLYQLDDNKNSVLEVFQKMRPQMRFSTVVKMAIKKRYIDAKNNNNSQIVINKLITTLLYKLQRKTWNNHQCLDIQFLLYSLFPHFLTYTQERFQAYIENQEKNNNDFYGSYASDDSDSEEEFTYHFYNDEEKCKQEATKNQQRAQYNRLFYTLNKNNHAKGDLKTVTEASALFNLRERVTIHYPPQTDLEKIERDLAQLNQLLLSGNTLEFAQAQVDTKFFCAQYRGITHLTSKWNQASRKAHRDDYETGKAQYSASVHAELGIEIYKDYAKARKQMKEQEQALDHTAETLHEILLTFREPRPCSYNGYSYPNLACLLQNLYTQDYDGFHQLIKSNPLLTAVLLNDSNPHLSTGDTPYHPLKYAAGIKPYKNHTNEVLMPRWKNDGTSERPYSGVTYTSLHPITDYDKNGPLHLVSLNREGEIRIKNELIIIAERESCFPAYLPKTRVIHKQVIKYPSFKAEYKEIYLYKYGIDKTFYFKLKTLRDKAKPHTSEMTDFKKLLGEWLCAWHEVRLIDIARKEAKKRGGVLVYRDINDCFSLIPPIDSINRNVLEMTDDIRAPVKDKQNQRARIGAESSQPEEIRLVTRADHLDDLLASVDINDCEEGLSISHNENQALNFYFSSIMNSIREKRYLALRKLLSSQQVINQLNQASKTWSLHDASPLHLAVLLDDSKAIEILCEATNLPIYFSNEDYRSYEHDVITYENVSPLAYAIIQGKESLIDTLIQSGRFERTETVHCLHNIDLLDEYMTKGPEPGDDETILGYCWAAREYFPITWVKNHSLVHLAVDFGNMAILNKLLIAGYPPNLKNAAGNSPLFTAIYESKFEIAVRLINAGAKSNSHIRDLFFNQKIPENLRESAARLTKHSFAAPIEMPEIIFRLSVELKKHSSEKPFSSLTSQFYKRRKQPIVPCSSKDIRSYLSPTLGHH